MSNAPAASHLPVLRALGRNLPIQKVVEYGCGMYSTLEFLNKKSFPRLIRLLSYEDDVRWVDRIRDKTGDPRLEFARVTPGQFSMQPAPRGFDMAFVDSSTADSRVALLYTIRKHPLVVLHDYSGPACYRDAATLWSDAFVYTKLRPHTGVFWNRSVRPDWLPVLGNLGALVC